MFQVPGWHASPGRFGEVPSHQWPAANNGPSVSTMDRAQTSQKCRNAALRRRSIFFASSPSKIWWNCTLMPRRKWIKKAMIRVFPLGHASRLSLDIFHTLLWQCTDQVSYTHATTKLQSFAEMIYFALPSFGSKSHQPTMQPWKRRKFPH